jgi:DNA-binding MarR family transcriptional regulator
MSKHDRPPTIEQLEIARWTASLGAITAEALAMRRGSSAASARGQLAAMKRMGMLSRHRPLADRPSLFTITRVGLRACEERGIEVCRVSPRAQVI